MSDESVGEFSAHRMQSLTAQTLMSEIRLMLHDSGVSDHVTFGGLNSGVYKGHMSLMFPDMSVLIIPVLAYTPEEFLGYAGYDFAVFTDGEDSPKSPQGDVNDGDATS